MRSRSIGERPVDRLSAAIFDTFDDEDCVRYVDGVARYEGVAGFRDSRGITLPRGLPGDVADNDTGGAMPAAQGRKSRIQVTRCRGDQDTRGVQLDP